MKAHRETLALTVSAFILLIVVGAFVSTHHREQTTCKNTPEGVACGFKWVGNK